MNRRVVRLLIAAGAAILSTACTPGGGSIYWTLENEEKVDDFTLPNDVSFFDVTKIGTSYYAAAGKIWTVGDSATQWDVNATVAPPVAGTDICTALAASPFDATLYGGFINGAGGRGLFKSTAAPSFAGASAETLPAAGMQVALLKVVNNGSDRLVIVTTWQPAAGQDYVFGIVYSASAGSYALADFGTNRPTGDEKKPVNDIIWSTTSTPDAWFATEGTKLYTNTSADMSGQFTVAGMTGITAGEALTGLFDDGTRIYVASRAGAVYHSTDGSTWTRIEAPTISGAHPPLTRFGGPFGDDDKSLLVGSDGYGIYRLPTTLSTIGSLTRDETSGLKSSAVMKLMLDAAQSRVFAGTSMGGLWRGTVSYWDDPNTLPPVVEKILKIVWNQE